MARASAYPLTFDPVANRERHVIRCECGNTASTAKGGRVALPVQAAAKRFQQAGWDASVKHPGTGVCPDCQKKPRLVYSMPMPTQESPMPAEKPQPIIVKADTPKQPDMDAVLLILDAVETNYDPKVGYSKGFNDQKIADELTCPVDWVRQVRVKKFGALPETPEVTELRHAIDALKTQCQQALTAFERDEDEADKALAEMEKRRLDRFNHNKARIDSLVKQLGALRERLEKLNA